MGGTRNQQVPGSGTLRPGLPRRTVLTAAGLGAAGVAAGIAARPSPRTVATGHRFHVPPDSVPHTRTWMAWPDSRAIWGQLLSGAQADIALIARTIARYEPVVMCANFVSAARAQSMCGPEVAVINSIPVDDCWMRDCGPIFRVNGHGGLDAVGLNFNGWGGKQTHATRG